MGHVTNQYYEIMQKTGMASIVALTTKKNPFPQEKVNYLLITGQMKYDSSEYATLKEKIQMAGYAVILVVEAAQIQIANRLLWECRNVTPDARILEVGIGSGMIAMQLAPCCKTYSGCDISKIVLDKLDGMAKERKMNNLRLYPYAADEIYHIQEKFDIILMSSVTEYFSGYNYLRKVIERCIEQIDGKGVILFADILIWTKKTVTNSPYISMQRHTRVCVIKGIFRMNYLFRMNTGKILQTSFRRLQKHLYLIKSADIKRRLTGFVMMYCLKSIIHANGRKKCRCINISSVCVTF